MNKILIVATALLVAGCSQEPASTETADDFASRVGAPGSVSEGGVPAPVETTAVKAAPPANADVFQLEKLGNIGGVDLGPRAGGCTFSVEGQEMLIAAAPADRALPGKATVRIGGLQRPQLLRLLLLLLLRQRRRLLCPFAIAREAGPPSRASRRSKLGQPPRALRPEP